MKVALITAARMNSRRYPGKCLATFRGKPLLQHTIDLAVELRLPIFVHTRDKEILEYVSARCLVLYEPEYLFDQPKSMTLERMRFCNRVLHADYVVLLQPTHPIRKTEIIKEWIDKTVACKAAYASSKMPMGEALQESGSFYMWSASKLLGNGSGPNATFIEEPPIDLHTPEDFARYESAN